DAFGGVIEVPRVGCVALDGLRDGVITRRYVASREHGRKEVQPLPHPARLRRIAFQSYRLLAPRPPATSCQEPGSPTNFAFALVGVVDAWSARRCATASTLEPPFTLSPTRTFISASAEAEMKV